MKPDKQLHEAWENAVALSDAWLVFAYAKNKKRFHELHLDDNHLGLRSHMEQELIWRIADGEFQAFGVEHGGDTGPIHIPKYYFSKNPEVDWDQETVEAFGKKFHVVRVQGEREGEPAAETQPSEEPLVIDLRKISTRRARERLCEPPPSAPDTSGQSHEIKDQDDGDPPDTPLPNEPPSSIKPRMGRPPLTRHIREVVGELVNGNAFDNLSKKEIVTLIRGRARIRFPALFPRPSQPSINKINEALAAEGWPPTPARGSS
jgi:hypothetical protein